MDDDTGVLTDARRDGRGLCKQRKVPAGGGFCQVSPQSPVPVRALQPAPEGSREAQKSSP